MERQQSNSLQNFEESKSDILKKRLLKSAATAASSGLQQNTSQNNVLINTLRTPVSGSMVLQSSPSSMSLPHNLISHSIAPMKLHNSAGYPLQLSTVHVPVQIPGTTSNISVPVQLSGTAASVPLMAPVSLPLQVSGTTSVPVQLPAGDTINVPLQIPANQINQNIQLAASMPSMPLLQNSSSIIHVHMGSNTRQSNIDGSTELNSSQHQLSESSQVKLNSTSVSSGMVSLPGPSSSGLQLAAPVLQRARSLPHVVYIQTPSGLKPVSSTDVISQASSSGNPPQIIVRRPVATNSNFLLSNVSNKPNIAPKVHSQKTSILAPGAAQPIVIQKPKPIEKMMPVTIAQGAQGKQAIYLSSLKKKPENQSILISNNQTGNSGSQKLFLTPMNMPKMQNTKFILPVTLPATMATKGPIINLQIANGQIQNDPQGNSITVMRETIASEASDMPPLQPLAKESVAQTQSEQSYTMSIPGSRAEPTGEQGEYTLSIPETNASMNDDLYTVSIADHDGGTHIEQSFTLAIPEKGKSLLNRNVIDRNDLSVAAPAILRRSNSDNGDRKVTNAEAKRRISLCNDNLSNKSAAKLSQPEPVPKVDEQQQTEAETNDDHRVPSLFCDEKLEEAKNNLGDSDTEENKERKQDTETEKQSEGEKRDPDYYFRKMEKLLNKERINRVSADTTVEDPLGLVWSNGVAQLRGSTLQFQTNEFGLIEVADANDLDEVSPLNAKYQTPLPQRSRAHKKPTSPEDLYRCGGCGCHGMAAEFITPDFCSVQCQSDALKASHRRRERERIDALRRRAKVKKLLVRKHSVSEDKVNNQYEELPPEPIKPNEELIENEKYPWMCGKNGFSWMRYLDHCKAKAAPVKLFKDPFPYNSNLFKVGMRMEAIDPAHPARFCVVSVAEVQGYRLRLHFDEYPEVYDYWVNADCPDLFPCGWCEKTGRALLPPAGYSAAAFSWPLYLKQQRAVAAPKHLFAHLANTSMKPHGFRVGMKLEAEDRVNDLVCVATVADVLDGRLRVSFDSWDEMYDVWLEPTSPYIHPVGWAADHNVPLTPPNFYKDPESFSWESYLAETGTTAAPARAFKPRPPAGFKPGMKLEVVDPRVPFLIRVATVSAASGHRVRVQCDGWGERLAAWRDDDSPHLHPVGWCLKTLHPLEPPLTPEELLIEGPCGTGGCRGLGSLRGGAHKTHHAAHSCPYRGKAPPSPPDRLAPATAVGNTARIPAKQLAKLHPSTPTGDNTKDTIRPRGRPPKHKRVEQVAKNDISDDESICSTGPPSTKRWRASPPSRTYSRTRSPAPAAAPPHPPAPNVHAEKYIAELGLPASPLKWTENDVHALVTRVAGAAAGAVALSARLRGAELLMASCEELVGARLRLGPAVKLRALQRQLREQLL